MNVRELNKDQLCSLKERIVCERFFNADEFPSYYDLAHADDTVSDEEVFELYDGTFFVPEDFN